jgi:hypothetical protein
MPDSVFVVFAASIPERERNRNRDREDACSQTLAPEP